MRVENLQDLNDGLISAEQAGLAPGAAHGGERDEALNPVMLGSRRLYRRSQLDAWLGRPALAVVG